MANETSNVTDDNDHQNQQQNANDQTLEAMGMLVDRLEDRLKRLQDSAFQVANYYFVFQGVILAAISNTSNLTCPNRSFLFTLSLLATIIDFFALFSTAKKYLQTLDHFDCVWREYNNLLRRRRPHQLVELLRGSLIRQRPSALEEDHEWDDCYTKTKRYIYLSIFVMLFLGFAGVILNGCWSILCRHNECKPRHNCVTLCNGVKCMNLCNDF